MYTYVYEDLMWFYHMNRLFMDTFENESIIQGQAVLAMRICGNGSSCCENKNKGQGDTFLDKMNSHNYKTYSVVLSHVLPIYGHF